MSEGGSSDNILKERDVMIYNRKGNLVYARTKPGLIVGKLYGHLIFYDQMVINEKLSISNCIISTEGMRFTITNAFVYTHSMLDFYNIDYAYIKNDVCDIHTDFKPLKGRRLPIIRYSKRLYIIEPPGYNVVENMINFSEDAVTIDIGGEDLILFQ